MGEELLGHENLAKMGSLVPAFIFSYMLAAPLFGWLAEFDIMMAFSPQTTIAASDRIVLGDSRWQALIDNVRREDVRGWRKAFVAALEQVAAEKKAVSERMRKYWAERRAGKTAKK